MAKNILHFIIVSFVAVLSAALSPTALADDDGNYFNHLLIFGDSLMDSGNSVDPALGTLTFTDPAAGVPGDVGYQAGQVTPDFFAEQMGLTLTPSNSGGNNYAAREFTTHNITATVSFYLQNAPRIDERTLVWLNGGSNDFLARGEVLAGILAGTSQLDESAEMLFADILAGAPRLAGAAKMMSDNGARYVMVSNLPNFTYTPFVYNIYQICIVVGTAAAVCDAARAVAGEVVGELVNGYNQALVAQLDAYGNNFIISDVYTLFEQVHQNPGAYGFEARDGSYDYLFQNCYNYDPSVTMVAGRFSDGCNEDPKYGRSAPNADAAQLIFADDVHPTQAFHRLVADYNVDIIYAPTEVALLPEIGLYGVRRQLDHKSKPVWQAGEAESATVVNPCFAGIDFDHINLAANGPAAQGDISGWGLHAGCTKRWSEEVNLGAQINLAKSKLQARGRSSSYEAQSIGFSGFVNFRRGELFANGGVAFNSSNIDANRVHTIGGGSFYAQGDTRGRAMGADVWAGYYLVDTDEWNLAPAVGYSFINSRVNGYQESGNSVSKYRWGDLRTSSRQIRGGVVGVYSPDKAWRANLRAFITQEMADDFREVSSGSHYLPGFQRDNETFANVAIAFEEQTESDTLAVSWNFSTQGGNSHLFGVSFRRDF